MTTTRDSMAAAFSVRISEGMARHLVEMYAKGAVAAIQEGDLQPGLVELGAADKVKLAQRVARLTAPMADYNTALANRVHDLVKGMVDEGKSPGEIANALRKSVPDFLNGEPISIQRPGKSRFTATPKQYAEMLARTMPNDIRNEGYIQKMKEMGVADGWIWDGIIDGSTCEKCKKEIRDRRVRSWDEPRPPQASHPGGCRCRPVAHIDKTKKEALKARVAELKAQAEAEKAAGPWPGLVTGPSVQAPVAQINKIELAQIEPSVIDKMATQRAEFSGPHNLWDKTSPTKTYYEIADLNAIPRDAMDDSKQLLKMYSYGGKYQTDAREQIISHIQNNDDIGKALQARIEYETHVYKTWISNHNARVQTEYLARLDEIEYVYRDIDPTRSVSISDQFFSSKDDAINIYATEYKATHLNKPPDLYRAGGYHKNSIESYTSQYEGAEMSPLTGGEPLVPDTVLSYDKMIDDGWWVLGGPVTPTGAPGEAEITLINMNDIISGSIKSTTKPIKKMAVVPQVQTTPEITQKEAELRRLEDIFYSDEMRASGMEIEREKIREKLAALSKEIKADKELIAPTNLAGGPSVQAKGAEKLAEPALEKAILDGVQKENELFSKYMNAPDGPEKTAIYSELTTLNADNSKLKQALADLRSGKTTPAMPKVTPSSPIISAPGPKLQKAPNIMSIDPKMEVKLDQKLDLINMHRDGVIKFNSIIDDELAKPSPDKNLIYYYADQANNDWKNADRIYRDANSLNTQIVSMGGADKSDKLNLVSPIKPKYTPDEVRMTIEAKTTGAVVSDWKVWQESLAEGERSALEDYTSTAHYQVNKYLRELPAGESIGEHMDQIVKLDSAIDKSKLKHQVVYRGINGEAGIDDLFARGVGTIISDPAYVSTSRLEAMAEAYAGKWGKNGILMEIHIPEGASGAYLEPITAVGHEEEILLPRNSKFGIISSTRSEKGYLKTVVELIL